MTDGNRCWKGNRTGDVLLWMVYIGGMGTRKCFQRDDTGAVVLKDWGNNIPRKNYKSKVSRQD